MICMDEKLTIRFYVDLPPDKHRQLRIIAATEGKSMKDIILECIEAKSNRADVERLAQGLAASCLSQPRKEG